MIGELESIQESKQLEWKIPNYVSLGVGTYKSPSFTFANHSWHLTISAELYTVHKYLTVILKCENDSQCTDVMYSFSIKKSDGTMTTTKTYQSSMVSEWPFLPLDEISLLPPSIITIFCNLKYGLDLNGGDAIASAQQETSVNEDSAVETLEHAILAETDVLSKNFKDLFFNGECCDVVVQVQDKEFQAHKTVLIARSSVFAAMFKHDTSEKETAIINVPDCDADTFKQFLEYLYSGKLEGISINEAVPLYRTSDKYDVKELKMFCTKYMMQNLTVEDVCDAVILADEYDETELLSSARKFFHENAKQIVKTKGWENLLQRNYRLANKFIIEMTESKG